MRGRPGLGRGTCRFDENCELECVRNVLFICAFWRIYSRLSDLKVEYVSFKAALLATTVSFNHPLTSCTSLLKVWRRAQNQKVKEILRNDYEIVTEAPCFTLCTKKLSTKIQLLQCHPRWADSGARFKVVCLSAFSLGCATLRLTLPGSFQHLSHVISRTHSHHRPLHKVFILHLIHHFTRSTLGRQSNPCALTPPPFHDPAIMTHDSAPAADTSHSHTDTSFAHTSHTSHDTWSSPPHVSPLPNPRALNFPSRAQA